MEPYQINLSMIKRYLILSAVAVTSLAMSAEKVDNYVQGFESECSVNDKTYTLPGSWGHIADGVVGDRSTTFPTYTYKTTGGVDNSKCIQVSDQMSVGGQNDDKGSTYDLLVTPEVSGTISIAYKKTYSFYDGFIEFYYLVEEDGALVRGEKIEIEMPEFTTDYQTISFELATPQRIGIRASYGCIDNFTASTAEVEKKRSLKISSVTNTTEGRTSPVCGPDNKFTVKAHFKLQNTGEADINPGDDNATVSLCWADGYKGENVVVLNTVGIDQAIPVGSTIEMDIAGEVDGNVYPNRETYGIKENISGTFTDIAYITPNLYKPKFLLLRSDNSQVSESTVNAGNYTIELGYAEVSAEKVYKVKNDGAGPLVVTSIQSPEGISVTPSEFTVEYGQTQEIKVAAEGTVLGAIEGTVKFNIEGADPVSMNLTATVLDPAKYYEGFEGCTDKKFPKDMIVVGPQSSSRWSVLHLSTSNKDKPTNDYLVENKASKPSGDRLILPLLEFDGTEQIRMDVYKISSNSSYQPQVSIYTSDDRAEWTLVDVLESSEMVNPIEGYYTTYQITPYTVTIPEGRHYIAIEANYVDIDDIYGGTRVDVDCDLYLSNVKTPATGMVNYDYTATVSIRNMKDEAVTATAALVVDGEVVAEEEIEVGALVQAQEVTLSYLCGEELEDVDAYFEVTVGETTFKSSAWSLNISAEMMVGESTVISETSTTAANVPFWVNWYRTFSETVYPAEVLDLEEGDVLTKIIYNGYSTVSDDKTLKIKVWIENCDDAAPSTAKPADESAMTQVANEYVVTISSKGNSSETVPLFEIPFSEPFTYTGGNIRVVTHVLLDAYCNGTGILVSNDDALKNNAMYSNDDNKSFEDAISKSWSTAKAPVVTFEVAVEPIRISGNVKSAKENSIESLAGAVVTLTALAPEKVHGVKAAQAVTYSATTDANGDYTILVMQPGLKYTLTAQAPDHFNYTHHEVIDPSAGHQNIDFALNYGTTGVSAVEAEYGVRKGIYNMQGIYLGEDVTLLAPGLYIIDGKKTIIR